MRAIRILYCIDSMMHGGTEKQLAALIRGCDRDRLIPYLCTLKPSAYDLAGLGCELLEMDFTSFRSAGTLRSVRQLRRFVRERRIDLLQTFFQDPAILGLLGTAFTPVRARIASFRDLGFWRTPAKTMQLRLSYRFFHGFIANSRAVARDASEHEGVPLDRIEVIYNGVLDRADQGRHVTPRPPTVGVVATLDRPVKRIDLFLEAARVVQERHPTTRFLVVGDGRMRPELERLAARLGLRDVVFSGSTTDVGRYLAEMDVGVMCSDSEGFSNAILEYMVSGVATVARNVGGNAELLTDRETGRLVGGADPESIADAITQLLANPELRRAIAGNARDVALTRFSMVACLRLHQQYYEQLFERSR
jgi:L-malate glycosyltransferase